MKSILQRMDSPKVWYFSALLFSILIFFTVLGSDGIYAAQEGRTAIITRNMILSGNWLDMTIPFGIPYEKPIGHYWLCAPFAALLGLSGNPCQVPAEWAVRLPSALSALLAVIAAALLARRIYGDRTAVMSILILSTMATFANLGRLAHIDMPLACAFAWAMYFLYMGCLEENKGNHWIYGFYVMLGWGTVLKGPLMIILAGLVILCVILQRRNWKLLWELRPISGGLLFLAVTLPWYVVETLRTNGAFYQEFIVNQNIRRFTGIGSTYRNGERMPIYYYVPKLLAGALPWSLAGIAAIICYAKRLIRLQFSPGSIFLLLWAISGFVFFSLSALKRGDYLLPIYPALAILTARAIDRFCEKGPALHRSWQAVWGGVAILSGVAAILNRSGILTEFGNRIASGEISFISKRDGMNLVMISNFINEYFFLMSSLLLLALGILWGIGKLLERRALHQAFFAITLVFAGLFTAYHAFIQPGTDHLKTVKPFARQVQELIPEGQKVIYFSDFNTELIFFVNRPYSITIDEDADFLMTDPPGVKALEQRAPGAWEELCRTEAHHQYPEVLLRRRR